MKTIGKIAVLAMTLSLAFVLTACGGSASSSTASSSASASASSASAAASSESASASASASASSAAASSSAAVLDADTYTNEAFGIQFKLPAGWALVDPSSITDLNAVIAGLVGNSELDMIALSGDASQMVLVGIEHPEGTGMTAQQHLDADIEGLGTALQGTFAYTTTSATITFDGIDRELPAAMIDVTIEGNHLYICEAVAEKDGYFFDVVSMAGTQDEAAKAFESFAAATS